MNSEWKEFKIGDIVSVRRGSSPRPIKNFICSNGIPWVKIADATSINSRFIDSTKEFIKLEGVKNSVIVNPGDLIVSNSATPGLPKFMNIKACVHDGWLIFDNYNGILKEYLYYYFVFIRKNLVNQANGTIFKNLKTDIVKNFVINLPNLHTQKRIVKILSNIDNDIELNNKLNQNLDEQIRTIFKSQFIKFDQFNEDELINVDETKHPCNWSVGCFNDIIDKVIAGDWGKAEAEGNNTKEVYCIRGADIPEVKNGNKGKMPIRFILPNNYTKKKLEAEDIVIEISGGSPTQSTGRVVPITQSLLNRYDRDMVCTNFCKVFKPKKDYSLFLYYYWQYLYDIDRMFAYENGTTGIKNLDYKAIIKLEKIIIPPIEEIMKFNNIIKPMVNLIYQNGLENEYLAKTRDLLLPKLMSGEIDVSKIEI